MKIRCIALTDDWAPRHLVCCVRDAQELPLHARSLLTQLTGATATAWSR